MLRFSRKIYCPNCAQRRKVRRLMFGSKGGQKFAYALVGRYVMEHSQL
jgi:hypothetical protein